MASYKFKYAKNLLVLSTLVSAVSAIIAWLASKKFDIHFNDSIFYAGMFLIVIGCFTLMKGNPSGASLSSLGQDNAKSSDSPNIEAISGQYKSAEYTKNFKNDRILKINLKPAPLLVGGITLVIYNILTTW
jgi:hypothetical protein